MIKPLIKFFRINLIEIVKNMKKKSGARL